MATTFTGRTAKARKLIETTLARRATKSDPHLTKWEPLPKPTIHELFRLNGGRR